MAMKKTSSGNSPLRQGARKSFRTLPIFGSTTAVDRDVFWKTSRVLRFFPLGVFIGEGASSEVDRGGLTHRGRGPPPSHAVLVCGHLVAPLHLHFGSPEASVKFWATSFGFVQF
jgi:hypothetical protein